MSPDRRPRRDCTVAIVDQAPVRFERRAAAAFLVASVPFAILVAAAGGLLALLPLLAVVVPILVTGRTPGFEALMRLRSPLRGNRRRMAPAISRPLETGLVPRPLPERPLSGRGPPLPA